MRTKPRLLVVASFPPPIHGSAIVSQYIRNSQLINECFECDYVNLSTSRTMKEIGNKNPLKAWRLVISLMRELWLLATRNYNLCYLAITCHGIGFLKDVPFVLLCKLFGRKIVIHQHNKGMTNDVDKWPFRWLLPLCYRNAKVILLSWRLYPDIEKIVRKEDVYVCPNGIPTVNCNSHVNDNKVPHLFFMSNLMVSKGVFILLDALKTLQSDGFSFVCDIVGSDTKEISLDCLNEEIDKRGLNGFVVYHGPKYGDEKNTLFEVADIFIHPTLDDTFGLVILEAMSQRIPVISTEEGGIPDIIIDGENGLICEKGNSTSLADNISTLLIDKQLRNKMGNAGYEMFHKKYTIEIFENRMANILKQLKRDL